MFQKNAGWLLPLIAMAILAPFTPDMDLVISHYFYSSDTGFTNNAFFTFLFNYGPLPAQITAALATMVLIISCLPDKFKFSSFNISKFKAWRRPAACLVLTMAIGAGLIVHAILKDHWGRPRPKQTTEFAGTQIFRPFYEPNILKQPEPSKSFSCGHCSMGFYFFALAFVGRRLHSKALFLTGMSLAILLGILLSLTRIAQGGHFFSDTLATALIMWLTAYVCDRWLYSKITSEAL
ncbi:MAG: phosphatase PAP2 family protein [Parachlamydiaceae bacterium]|nr:phosphatase PAP2 family protein [Parachlamydiaceae bacterium]